MIKVNRDRFGLFGALASFAFAAVAASALFAPTAAYAAACAPAWAASTVYTAGNTASENGINYVANWWTQGNDPATNNGGSGTGEPWTSQGACGGATCTTTPGAPTGLSASATTQTGTTLSWTAVSAPANCSISSYTVYKGGVSIGTSTTATFAVTGLTASTTYTFTVAATDAAGVGAQSSSISVTTPSGGSTEAPYGGTAAAVPGTVQAENYDTGGQGVAYNVTSTNGSANSYRSDGIDLEACTDSGGGYDLGWTAAGQWFRYTVNVATAGTYTASLRVAAAAATGTTAGTCYIENSAGTNLTGTVNVPGTGGWQTWATVNANLTLAAGQQVLTVYQASSGYNLNWISFASGGTCIAPPPAPTGLAASGTTSSSTTLSWSGVTAPSGCSIAGYTVYLGSTALATVSSGTSYTATGLSASTTYSFTVAAVDSAGAGSHSSSVSVTTATSDGLNPSLPPGKNFNLSGFTLQLPTGSSGDVDTESGSALAAGFTDAPYFYTDPNDGSMVMADPHTGWTTSGSLHPRVEFRENATWPTSGTNIETASVAVTEVPSNTTIGQIFQGSGPSKPLCELQVESSGAVQLLLENTNEGGDATEHPVGTVSIGSKFTYSLQLEGTTVTVKVNGTTSTFTMDSSFDGEDFYFKAGDYDQTAVSGTPTTTVSTIVKFYALAITH